MEARTVVQFVVQSGRRKGHAATLMPGNTNA